MIPKSKPGVTLDQRNPLNYRPITVSSCFLRLFEGILVRRLHTAKTRLISDKQGGFVKGRGTVEQVFAVREICWRHKKKRKPLALAFLDFRKAFDSVWHDALLYKIWSRFGIKGKLWRLVKMLLSNNYVRVQIASVKTDFTKLEAGTRQGGMGSPFLFNLFIDDAVEELEASGCGVTVADLVLACLLYADDVVLFGSSPESLQTLLSTIGRWAEKWRLTFNVKKFKILVVVENKKGLFRNSIFTLQGESVSIVREFDYLGSELNSRLSFTNTPKKMRKKVETRINFLRWVAAARNGLRSHVILPVYRTIVRPLLTTNGQIAAYTKTGILQLETTQAMALKRLLRLPMFTKTASLLVLTGVPPVVATLDHLFLTFWYKMMSTEVDYLAKLTLASMEDANDARCAGEAGDGWCCRVWTKLQQYGEEGLWVACDLSQARFSKKVSHTVLSHHAAHPAINWTVPSSCVTALCFGAISWFSGCGNVVSVPSPSLSSTGHLEAAAQIHFTAIHHWSILPEHQKRLQTAPHQTLSTL